MLQGGRLRVLTHRGRSAVKHNRGGRTGLSILGRGTLPPWAAVAFCSVPRRPGRSAAARTVAEASKGWLGEVKSLATGSFKLLNFAQSSPDAGTCNNYRVYLLPTSAPDFHNRHGHDSGQPLAE